MMHRPMHAGATQSEDRREWLRIDDRVLLEYRLITELEESSMPGMPPVSDQAIADAPGMTLLSVCGQKTVKDAAL